VVGGVSHTEKSFIGGDFNGHIGSTPMGCSDEYGGFGFVDKNAALIWIFLCIHGRRRTPFSYFVCLFPQNLNPLLKILTPVLVGALGSSSDTNNMWFTTSSCIRKRAREVLVVSNGRSG